MDDVGLKLLRAQHLIEAGNRERIRLEQTVRKQDLELRRLRNAVVRLQRQTMARTKGKPMQEPDIRLLKAMAAADELRRELTKERQRAASLARRLAQALSTRDTAQSAQPERHAGC